MTVLFDLDGTMFDTAPDLLAALNKALNTQGMPSISFKEGRHLLADGGRVMLHKVFKLDMESVELKDILAIYLSEYEKLLEKTATKFFTGMENLIEFLESRQIHWGIVTNKPAYLTTKLLDNLTLKHTPHCVVSGDTAKKPKPDPAPLFLACDLIGVAPDSCLYIGDHKRDIVAGNKAGMKTIGVSYGYIDKGDDINQWGADAVVASVEQLTTVIKSWLPG